MPKGNPTLRTRGALGHQPASTVNMITFQCESGYFHSKMPRLLMKYVIKSSDVLPMNRRTGEAGRLEGTPKGLKE